MKTCTLSATQFVEVHPQVPQFLFGKNQENPALSAASGKESRKNTAPF